MYLIRQPTTTRKNLLPAALVVEEVDEVELLVGPVLHLLSDPEDVQRGQGQGRPAVVTPRPRRLGIYDLCGEEIGSRWALIIFLLRL